MLHRVCPAPARTKSCPQPPEGMQIHISKTKGDSGPGKLCYIFCQRYLSNDRKCIEERPLEYLYA
jgi:hypothetical protein